MQTHELLEYLQNHYCPALQLPPWPGSRLFIPGFRHQLQSVPQTHDSKSNAFSCELFVQYTFGDLPRPNHLFKSVCVLSIPKLGVRVPSLLQNPN